MYNSHKRNTDPELMDDPDIDSVLLQKAVDDINKVNRLLGGFKFTLDTIKKIEKNIDQKNIVIADVGCSDGSMLRYLADHLKGDRYRFIGIDISEKSIKEAKAKTQSDKRISFQVRDVFDLDTTNFKCDILTSTLTMHHFSDRDIIRFLIKFKQLANNYVIINDLHRNRVAFNLFKYFSPFFIRNKISRHDGLISIASGFKRTCFKEYAEKASIKNDLVQWKWSFRYLWIIPTYER